MTSLLDRILTEPEVLKITTLSKAGLRRAMIDGIFPSSLWISEKRRGWRASDVAQWMADLKAPKNADEAVKVDVNPER